MTTRTFNGKYFDLEFSSQNKRVISNKAKQARKLGHNARIIKRFNGAVNVFDLYVSRAKAK